MIRRLEADCNQTVKLQFVSTCFHILFVLLLSI